MRSHILTSLFAAIVLAAISFGPAHAMSSKDKATLDGLSPELRAQVESRMGPEQSVQGILETILLNRLSEMFASARYFEINWDRSMARVVGGPSDQKTVQYNPTTLVIIEQ